MIVLDQLHQQQIHKDSEQEAHLEKELNYAEIDYLFLELLAKISDDQGDKCDLEGDQETCQYY